MIKDIESLGKHLRVATSSAPFVAENGQSSGIVRYNTIKQCLEAFDGSSWINITRDFKIGLDPDAEEAIEWAKSQIKHRNNMLATLDIELSKNASLKQAYEHFRTLAALVYEGKTDGQN